MRYMHTSSVRGMRAACCKQHLCSGVSEVDSSSCATASMPLSGVRISWLILACIKQWHVRRVVVGSCAAKQTHQ